MEAVFLPVDGRLSCETGAGVSPSSGRRSFVEIEVTGDRINLLERQGDGKTGDIVALLRKYGLILTVRVDSPCG